MKKFRVFRVILMTAAALAAATGLLLSSCELGTDPGIVIPQDSRVQQPIFSPTGVEYSHDISVTLSTTTPRATIHYTTDGTRPTVDSPEYLNPIPVQGNGTDITIMAFAVIPEGFSSTITSHRYLINYTPGMEQVATPVISPESGEYSADTEVTISCATEGAEIRFIMDTPENIPYRSSPTEESPLYSAPIRLGDLPSPVVIRVRAFSSGMTPSSTVSRTFSLEGTAVALPQFTPAETGIDNPANYADTDISVMITVETPGAEIFYTMGNDIATTPVPTKDATPYTGPIAITGDGTERIVRAVAFHEGLVPSSVTTAEYGIRYPPAVPDSLEIAAIDPTTAQLNWHGSADSYQIEQSSSEDGPWTVVATDYASTTLTIDNLTAGTTVYFRVSASDAYKTSDWSTVVQITLPASPQ